MFLRPIMMINSIIFRLNDRERHNCLFIIVKLIITYYGHTRRRNNNYPTEERFPS